MIETLKQLKGKTKLKFYKNISNYYYNMNIKMHEDLFVRNAQSISKIYQEVLLLMKFLQTEPQIKNMINKYYDLYYTVIRNRDDKEIVNDKYEDNDNDYINFDDIVIPNHKPRETILKYRNFISQINHFKYFLLFK